MKILILPGNHKINKKWLDEIKNEMKNIGFNINTLEYAHWKTGNGLINLSAEANRLPSGEIVIARSAGIILALKAIDESKLHPKKCIFIGMPVRWAKEYSLPLLDYLEKYKIPTLFIQNTGDPTCSSKELREIIKKYKVGNVKIVEIKENSHDYDDLGKTIELIKSFILEKNAKSSIQI